MEDSGIDSDPRINSHMEDDIGFAASDSSSSSGNNHPPVLKSTTKQLQKKLEARIEQAKRIQRNSEYTKLPNKEPDNCSSNTAISSTLIPIQRLPIPLKKRKQDALVDFWHSDSDSENEIFPAVSNENSAKHKQDLTDTFSIEELSEGSEDSLHLGSTPDVRTRNLRVFPPDCLACKCNCRVM